MPPGRTSRRKRSAAAWGLRGAIAVALLILGFASVFMTLANVVADVDAGWALALAPGDGQITAAAAAQSFQLDNDPAVDARSENLARRAIQQDPTAVAALSVLALRAQLRGDDAQARELFSYSHLLSRRELKTQIWVIEEAVARGDIQRALEQYDLALSTSRSARDILFPVLASALVEPAVRTPLIQVMMDAAWTPAFLRYAAANAGEPQAVITFFLDGSRYGLPVTDAHRSRLTDALVADGETEAAWRFFQTFRKDASRHRSRNPDFAATIDAPAVFDWTTHSPRGLSSSIQRGNDGSVFHFSASSGAGGVVLRQNQVLPAGEYLLESTSQGIEQPEYSRPYWTLICVDGQNLGRAILPNSGREWASLTGRFTVPSDCPFQTLALVVRGSDAITGIEGQIDTALLIPATGLGKLKNDE